MRGRSIVRSQGHHKGGEFSNDEAAAHNKRANKNPMNDYAMYIT
jgi:hypothetical protein